MASIVPYKVFAAFAAIGRVPPRRDGGIPPYRAFQCLHLVIKCVVGNGLDRSETYEPYPTRKNYPNALGKYSFRKAYKPNIRNGHCARRRVSEANRRRRLLGRR